MHYLLCVLPYMYLSAFLWIVRGSYIPIYNYTIVSEKMGQYCFCPSVLPFVFSDNMVKGQILVVPFTATIHHSHFKLGIVLRLGSNMLLTEFKSASYLLPVVRLTIFFPNNMVKCQIFVALCWGYTHRFLVPSMRAILL